MIEKPEKISSTSAPDMVVIMDDISGVLIRSMYIAVDSMVLCCLSLTCRSCSPPFISVNWYQRTSQRELNCLRPRTFSLREPQTADIKSPGAKSLLRLCSSLKKPRHKDKQKLDDEGVFGVYVLIDPSSLANQQAGFS